MMGSTNRFKECREKTVYSQKQVAMMIGVKPPQLSKWETGTSRPSLKHCIELSKLYNVSVDYLLENETEQEKKPQQKEAPSTKALDRELIDILTDLNSDQVQRVLDFVAGMKANHKA